MSAGLGSAVGGRPGGRLGGRGDGRSGSERREEVTVGDAEGWWVRRQRQAVGNGGDGVLVPGWVRGCLMR